MLIDLDFSDFSLQSENPLKDRSTDTVPEVSIPGGSIKGLIYDNCHSQIVC